MSTIEKYPFGKTTQGEQVLVYRMKNKNGVTADILNYGGIVHSLMVPDQNGVWVDVVLGHDTVQQYEQADSYMGALIGRHANRIGNARFELNGATYELYQNDKTNCLHGGKEGFDQKIWQVSEEDGALILRYVSLDGEEGFPGTLTVTVKYTLSDDNSLVIDYHAVSDADTVCNLTNHSYFNLSGHDSGDVLDQWIQIFADYYTPADEKSLPVGRVEAVDGTPFDLRKPVKIGEHICDDFDQLRFANGFDHNWVVNGEPSVLRPMAHAYSEKTGIRLDAYTTEAGVQFYSGNFLNCNILGKGGVVNDKRSGFCLESQYFPNSLAHPEFPQPILRKEKEYRQTTVYRFSL